MSPTSKKLLDRHTLKIFCMQHVTCLFFQFLFLEKVIVDAINVIKTNKKNLKKTNGA